MTAYKLAELTFDSADDERRHQFLDRNLEKIFVATVKVKMTFFQHR